MKISFAFTDNSMPRTVFYDLFVETLSKNARFTASESQADVLFPAEDTALETNWPRYGNRESAFVRGARDDDRHKDYIQKLAASGRPLCIVNMNPFLRLPMILAEQKNIIIADGSLPIWERTINPRTISMPALPIASANGVPPKKTVVASFRGVLSHPCRSALQKLHDGTNIICDIVTAANHIGRIDATTRAADSEFTDLLAKSLFAFVPRGDALFSYRLLEAMSFGCIPIVVSDGWVLPFDKIVDWQNLALHIPESEIPNIPRILQRMSWRRTEEMQLAVNTVYTTHFANLDIIVETLVAEVESLLS